VLDDGDAGSKYGGMHRARPAARIVNVDHISRHARISSPELEYMRAFAEEYPDREFVQQIVALLPWGHQVRLVDMLSSNPLIARNDFRASTLYRGAANLWRGTSR
jgi:hypothetical protein